MRRPSLCSTCCASTSSSPSTLAPNSTFTLTLLTENYIQTVADIAVAVEGTGRGFSIDQAVITHLRDGKVVEAWEIADIAALREQVGPG